MCPLCPPAFHRFAHWLPVMAVVLSSLLAVAFSATSYEGANHEGAVDDTTVFMRAKLASSQTVMEGLVTEDFYMIKKGAQEMHTISHANRWPQAPDKVYEYFNQSFRNECKKLVELAEAKNLQGAHYTYLHMTTSCIDCHNYVRGKYRVKKTKDSKGPIQLIPTEWDSPNSGKSRRIPVRPSKSLRDRDG